MKAEKGSGDRTSVRPVEKRARKARGKRTASSARTMNEQKKPEAETQASRPLQEQFGGTASAEGARSVDDATETIDTAVMEIAAAEGPSGEQSVAGEETPAPLAVKDDGEPEFLTQPVHASNEEDEEARTPPAVSTIHSFLPQLDLPTGDTEKLTPQAMLLDMILKQTPEFVFSKDVDKLVEGINRLDGEMNELRYWIGRNLNKISEGRRLYEAYGFVSVNDFIQYLARELKVSVSSLYRWKKDAILVDDRALLFQNYPDIHPIKMFPGIADFVSAYLLDDENGAHYAKLLQLGKYAELKAAERRLRLPKTQEAKPRPPVVTGRRPVCENELSPFQKRLYAFIQAGLTPVVCGLDNQEQEAIWEEQWHKYYIRAFNESRLNRKVARQRAFDRGERNIPHDLDALVAEITQDLFQLRKNMVHICVAVRELWEDDTVLAQINDRGFSSVEAFCVKALPHISVATCRAYRDIGNKLLQYHDELDRAGFGEHSCAWNLTQIETALTNHSSGPELVFLHASHLDNRSFRDYIKGCWPENPVENNPRTYSAKVVRKAQSFEVQAKQIRAQDSYPGVIGVFHAIDRNAAWHMGKAVRWGGCPGY